jgi:phytoene synthase
VFPANFSEDEPFVNLDRIDRAAIEAAYDYCRETIRRGSKGFYFSTLFLPPEKRRAMWAVYHFCRYTDDLVDKAEGLTPPELQQVLSEWEAELRRSFEGEIRRDKPAMLAWQHTAARYCIDLHPPLELIEGVRMDLTKTRYANYDELRLYCYRVASTVGLMASQVIGYSHSDAIDYAVELGIAMQLTNILRDVGEDAAMGRIYLPQDEMAAFGYSEEELRRGIVNENFVRLMQFQIERARACYARAVPGIEFLSRDCRLAITVAAEQYSRILDAIERNHYDVFTRRACVPLSGKLKVLTQVWLRRALRPLPAPADLHELRARGEFAPIIFPRRGEEADA